jgi:flagellar hook-basal body complex protein FliE
MSTINTSNFRQMNPDLGQISQDQFSIRQPQVGSVGGAPQSSPSINEPKGGGFLETLQRSMEEVNVDQVAADNSIKDLVAGKSKNIHETMLQIQKADLSLKTMMQVRNKILEAYKEIIRMQV